MKLEVVAEIDPLSSYRPIPDIHDEMVDPSGQLRKHWDPVIGALRELGSSGLSQRWDRAQHIIRENGVTYNVYADPRGTDRPWQLDPIPLMITKAEWVVLEQGLIQRAKLFNALLADCYGPQQLLREGVVPPGVVFSTPNFLRAAVGVQPAWGCYIPVCAVDLLRAPDGRWNVIADRCHAPAGAGYALENRIVTSRTLPEAFRVANIERLAGFFAKLRDLLARLSPRKRDGRVVVLTPGPYHATYFEQAYLARYLGYPLVEGGDLTMRDGMIYLKTVAGLEQVDVILRRVDDVFTDPLEFRADSQLGVPGLMQAVRAGNVVVVNPLGAGLGESLAFQPYLKGAAQALLGEELILEHSDTLWLGDVKARQTVFKDLDDWTIKRCFIGWEIGPRPSREQLLKDVSAAPWDYVAQRQPEASTAPIWERGKLVPRPVAIRAFLVANDEGGYVVMPGGLAVHSPDARAGAIALQTGGSSQDVWVVADGPVNQFSLLRNNAQMARARRGRDDLPSRVADNLFWLGRYAERCGSHLRLFRSALNHLIEFDIPTDVESLTLPITMLADQGLIDPKHLKHLKQSVTDRSLEKHLGEILQDQEHPNGLISMLSHLRRLSSTLRDRLTPDSWRILHNLSDVETYVSMLVHENPSFDLDLALRPLELMLDRLAAFSGFYMDNLSQGPAYLVLDIGRRLERAAAVINLVRTAMLRGKPLGDVPYYVILNLNDSTMTYRSRFLSTPLPGPVLEVVVTDMRNPRALAYQIDLLSRHIQELPGSQSGADAAAFRAIERAKDALRISDPERLVRVDESGELPGLEKLLDAVESSILEAGDVISAAYLTHATPPRSLAGAERR